jgi:hypothetical protein
MIIHQVRPPLPSFPFPLRETELPNPNVSYLRQICASLISAVGFRRAVGCGGWIRARGPRRQWDSGAAAGSWRAARGSGWFTACRRLNPGVQATARPSQAFSMVRRVLMGKPLYFWCSHCCQSPN